MIIVEPAEKHFLRKNKGLLSVTVATIARPLGVLEPGNCGETHALFADLVFRISSIGDYVCLIGCN